MPSINVERVGNVIAVVVATVVVTNVVRGMSVMKKEVKRDEDNQYSKDPEVPIYYSVSPFLKPPCFFVVELARVDKKN